MKKKVPRKESSCREGDILQLSTAIVIVLVCVCVRQK